MIIFLLPFILLPAMLSYLLYSNIRDRRGYLAGQKILGIIIIGFNCWLYYHIIDFFWPYDRSYKNSFVQMTGANFPAKGKIVYKDYDWWAHRFCCAVEINSESFRNLKYRFPANDSMKSISAMTYFADHYKDNHVVKAYHVYPGGPEYAQLLFMDDGKTMIYTSGYINED